MNVPIPEKRSNSAPAFQPAHDVLHYEQQPLDAVFAPRNVALIGATETPGSVGGTILSVTPKRPGVLGIRAYPSVRDVPEPVDLAVIVTPAGTVPGIIG